MLHSITALTLYHTILTFDDSKKPFENIVGKHTYLPSLGILGKKRNYFPMR